VVEVEGQRLLQPACIVKAAQDMKVQTRSERVLRARRTILEMLASHGFVRGAGHPDHDEGIWRQRCPLPGSERAVGNQG